MSDAARNLPAALAMVAAMASFCINDAFMKALAVDVPIGELMAVRGVLVTALMPPLLHLLGLPLGRPDRFAILRGIGELLVGYAFIAALRHLPLGDTYTLYFSAPIILTAAAALLFGEKVGHARWLAVLGGFAGVLVAVGLPSQWQPAAALALLAALVSVARDIVTRMVAAEVGSGTVALTTGVIVMLGGFASAASGNWVPLGWLELLGCALAALGAAGGYVGFVAGMRIGDISFVATFRYSAIPLAMLLGLVIWGDLPSPRMAVGALVIIASGVFILVEERWRRRG